jgi:hypothetical protein
MTALKRPQGSFARGEGGLRTFACFEGVDKVIRCTEARYARVIWVEEHAQPARARRIQSVRLQKLLQDFGLNFTCRRERNAQTPPSPVPRPRWSEQAAHSKENTSLRV